MDKDKVEIVKLVEIGNSFASKEDAQKTINRILTALKRIRN